MPKVFDWRGYRFHFYSEEGDPCEPVHIHPGQALFDPVAVKAKLVQQR